MPSVALIFIFQILAPFLAYSLMFISFLFFKLSLPIPLVPLSLSLPGCYLSQILSLGLLLVTKTLSLSGCYLSERLSLSLRLLPVTKTLVVTCHKKSFSGCYLSQKLFLRLLPVTNSLSLPRKLLNVIHLQQVTFTQQATSPYNTTTDGHTPNHKPTKSSLSEKMQLLQIT